MLNGAGLKKTINEFDCKKTKNGYVLNATSNFGGKTTRVGNNEIMFADSMARENLYNFIQFYTWYFEETEKDAEDLLMNSVYTVAYRQAETANKLVEYLSAAKGSH